MHHLPCTAKRGIQAYRLCKKGAYVKTFSLPDNIISLRMRNQNTEWEELLHLAVRSEVCKGTIIHAQNTKGFYYIQTGCVRLERLFSSGEGQIALFFEDGTFFAETPSILYGKSNPEDSSTFFHVQEDAVLYKFSEDLLVNDTFAKEYPHLIMNLLRSVAYKSALLLRNGTSNIIQSPEERICRYLVHLVSQANGNLHLNPKISQTNLGLALGIPRSTLCRAIAQLRNKGVLGTFTASKVEILNLSLLRKLASL